jgi:hypothetical protein
MKPILFSTPMVQAILDGRKTMTRRVVKENNKFEQITLDRLCSICGFFDEETMNYGCTNPECGETGEDINGKEHGRCFSWSCPFGQEWGYEDDCESSFDGDTYMRIPIPKYQVGEILWVRETWTKWKNFNGKEVFVYKADNNVHGVKWKPSIFMPKEACRIFLRVTNVRVERLQDIGYNDLSKEGFLYNSNNTGTSEPIKWFKDLWNSINGKGAWEENPYVFVYEFERAEKLKDNA